MDIIFEVQQSSDVLYMNTWTNYCGPLSACLLSIKLHILKHSKILSSGEHPQYYNDYYQCNRSWKAEAGSGGDEIGEQQEEKMC